MIAAQYNYCDIINLTDGGHLYDFVVCFLFGIFELSTSDL